MQRNDFILLIFFGLLLLSICAVAATTQLDLSQNTRVLSSIANADSEAYRRESAEATIRVYQAQAHWASISAVISAIGAVATAAGLIFVAAQLRISQQQLHKDRAYIHFDGMKWLSFTKPRPSTETECWGIFPRWINTGVTPALNVNLWYASSWLPVEELPDWSIKATYQPTTIRQGGQIEMSPIMLSPDDIMRSGHLGSVLCIWGAATYNDVFQKRKKRETRFCVKILGYSGDLTLEWDEQSNPVNIHFANVGENWAT
ncbi:hypothetical protein DEVEQU_01114 [Devosia equisanguinis]|uniref:Uncharacterized protein n=1 Tax=Devosia equisanguinis TaxID=2490941 RepID=A0A447I980_9HYPH|nr:hypothetical protein [Devosia equisanguinis]VDS03985.1 hypothetical protein DEVEQU_01114 [Devosia equisanguinis]